MKILKFITVWIPLGIIIACLLAAYSAKTTDISAYCSYNCIDLIPGEDPNGCDPSNGFAQCTSQCRPINFPGGVCMPTDTFVP